MLSQTDNLFSVDLPLQAKQHILFLRNLHKHGITINNDRSNYQESFRRYSDLWLPFVHKHGCTSDGMECALIPPADIAWMWHCHRLAPYRYARFVSQKFVLARNDDSPSFQVLDASHPFVFQLENNDTNETMLSTATNSQEHADIAVRTRELFLEMYPNESFFLKSNSNNAQGARSTAAAGVVQMNNTQLAGFDVVESCIRQSTFLWQVSGPRFNTSEFLEEGVSNYAKFVKLMDEKSKPQYLVPTYQIDLMWHTHMLSSIAKYHEDNMRINGCTLEHDDSLNDRTEGGKLDTSFQATRKLWDRIYGVEYNVPGGMYRGEPPVEYFRADWAADDGKHIGVGDGMNLPHPMTLAHLIGQVGASSHGREEWMSVDAPGAFLEALPRSTERNVNANPMKEGYIFGKESKGVGHYSLKTREAYNVTIKRIEAKNRAASRQIWLKLFISVVGLSVFYIFISRILSGILGEDVPNNRLLLILFIVIGIGVMCWNLIGIFKQRGRIKENEDVKEVAILRKNAAGPNTELLLPAGLQERVTKRSTRNGSTNTNHDSAAYYSGAAACGVMTFGYYGGGGVGGEDSGGACGGGGACGSG